MNKSKTFAVMLLVAALLALQFGSVMAAPLKQGSPPTGEQHPVGLALAEFFGDLAGVDYETIMEYHEQGMGFGVIAQALWMTKKLEGDSTIFSAILLAKQNGDYGTIALPDGSTPQNWGQFRKALLFGDKKANLGAIMSGRAESTDGTTTQSGNPGHGHGRGHGKGLNK